MKKIFPFIVSLFVGAVLFVWILKVVGFEKITEAARVLTCWDGLLIFALTMAMAILGTFKWKEILRGEGAKISFRRLLGPYLAGYAAMLLAPIIVWGGELLRGYFLKEKISISWVKGLSSVIIDRILEWTVNLIIIFLAIIFFVKEIKLIPQKVEIFFGAILLLLTAAIIYFYFKVIKKESIIEVAANLFGLKKIEEENTLSKTEKEIFNFFKIKNKTLWTAFFLSFLRAGIMWFRVFVLILLLEKTKAWISSVSILGFYYLAVLIPIPAALGSHEAIQTFVFGVLGFDKSNATVFTMVIRGAEIMISLAGIVFLFKYGVEFSKKLFFKKIEKISEED